MEFIDLAAQQQRLAPEIDRRLHAVLAHGRFIMGPEVAELEARLAAWAGVAHCISCASGTDALYLSLLAHGIGPGDAVFTTPFTFFATAEVIALVGATPVFVDVDPATYNLDPAALEHAGGELAAGRPPAPGSPAGLRARAVIPVDIYGLPADYRRINAVAADHGLVVIEDAAQSFGGELDGVPVGALARLTATSFFPSKPLGCYGDGGALLTDDAELAAILRSLRVHGKGAHKYDNVRLGVNSRLDTVQAAILLAKLTIFAEELRARRQVADRYSRLLAELVQVPHVPADRRSAWAQYAVMLSRRDEVAAGLERRGVPTAVYYPTPLHLQPALAHLGYAPGSLPVSEDLARRVLCLPMHPYLTEAQQDLVVTALAQVIREVGP
jgi:UDP-2-acetamido-2-deoxy-ribo-hexuluronate aminotransferase